MLLYCGKEVCNVTNCGFVPPGGSRIVPAGDGGGKGVGGFAVGMHVSFLDFFSFRALMHRIYSWSKHLHL